MGYESRLYIVEKSTLKHINKEKVWGEVIAHFDLSKIGKAADKFLSYPDTDCFIYADNGNDEILEDKYGDNLKEIPIEDAIRILIEAAEKDNWYYRRFSPAIGLLKGFDLNQWDNLVVLHYGY